MWKDLFAAFLLLFNSCIKEYKECTKVKHDSFKYHFYKNFNHINIIVLKKILNALKKN